MLDLLEATLERLIVACVLVEVVDPVVASD